VAKDSALLHEVDIVLLREDGGVAALDLQVVDPRGEPVNGAEVFLDGFSQGKTTELGLQVGERSAGERRLEIRAPAFRNYAEMVELSEDSGTHKVHLKWGPGAVRVKVTAADVPVRDAVIRGIGPAVVQPVPVNVEGERILSLAPGQWQLIVASGDYGFSQASLTIPESSEGLVEVPIELEAIDEGFGQVLFRIRGANDEPISGAKIKLDGELKGESEDGALLCDMLFPGQSSLTVEADNFLPLSIGALTIKPGSQQFIVALEPLTYEVFVRVTNGAGEPVEAAVSFTGPADIPSVQTGPSGEFRGWLPSGDWQVIASGDGLGPLRETLRIGSVQKKYEVDMLLRASRIEARGQTVIPEKIGFAYDSDRLTAESAPILDEVANFVTARPGIVSIEVQGHTDASGLIAYNQDLSRRRALAVLEALIIRGVAPERLLARGYGTQRPLVPGRTQDAYATNRRVEFVILEEYDYSRPW
jgi:outer membrane protein OmpA-like peptidoglycan-associated protein